MNNVGRNTLIGTNYLLREPTIIYHDCVIGERFTTGHYVLIRERCIIGDDVNIGSFSELSHDVIIGHRVHIHSACFVPEGTHIMDDAWIGPHVCFTNDKFPGPASAAKHRQPVIVEHHAVIGANATILPGIRIGHHALVGAGAVVTKDVAPYSTVVGNPAKPLSS